MLFQKHPTNEGYLKKWIDEATRRHVDTDSSAKLGPLLRTVSLSNRSQLQGFILGLRDRKSRRAFATMFRRAMKAKKKHGKPIFFYYSPTIFIQE